MSTAAGDLTRCVGEPFFCLWATRTLTLWLEWTRPFNSNSPRRNSANCSGELPQHILRAAQQPLEFPFPLSHWPCFLPTLSLALNIDMETIETKMEELTRLHDWYFPADKLEKQVRLQAAIAEIENLLESFSRGYYSLL